ncbi:alpha/beta hydrolase fold domain-containing protein [Pengzhenrongella phosphoraccumulans]|uniref:alpha/beta hydrolase fold domain-containing protein n=1 Tax=Pengzhenrongella phosphoraccumulans TaxID=3114394 RepID=UPI00388EC259
MTVTGGLVGGKLDVPATIRGATSHRGVTFAEVGGFRPLLLDVHVPTGVTGSVPCVVWVHGGGWEAGDRRFTPSTWPPDYLFEALVAAGLAVATVDYRFSGEARYPAALHDVKAAVRFLRAHAGDLGIDPGRFGVCGESAGGQLAAMIALTGDDPAFEGDVGLAGPSTAVQAAAILYGVTDFTSRRSAHPLASDDESDAVEARFLGFTPADAPSWAAAASPVTHATSSAPPMLLLSGDADTIVPLDQSVRLRDALLAAGARDVTLTLVPGADHCFEGTDPRPPLDETVKHFTTHLA